MAKPDDKDEDERRDNGPEDKDTGKGGGRPASEYECEHICIFIKHLFPMTMLMMLPAEEDGP